MKSTSNVYALPTQLTRHLPFLSDIFCHTEEGKLSVYKTCAFVCPQKYEILFSFYFTKAASLAELAPPHPHVLPVSHARAPLWTNKRQGNRRSRICTLSLACLLVT